MVGTITRCLAAFRRPHPGQKSGVRLHFDISPRVEGRPPSDTSTALGTIIQPSFED